MGFEACHQHGQYSADGRSMGNTNETRALASLFATRRGRVVLRLHTGQGQLWRGWTIRPQSIHLTIGTLSDRRIAPGFTEESCLNKLTRYYMLCQMEFIQLHGVVGTSDVVPEVLFSFSIFLLRAVPGQSTPPFGVSRRHCRAECRTRRDSGPTLTSPTYSAEGSVVEIGLAMISASK